MPHHPKAFLSLIRNIEPGLSSRSQIISVLEKGKLNANQISRETDLKYGNVLYHLRLLNNEKIVIHSEKSPYLWELTGIGQLRLTD